MIIALINWRVLPSEVDAFLNKWKAELKLNNAPGLIGEFLSGVEDSSFHEGVTWEMEADDKDDRWRCHQAVPRAVPRKVRGTGDLQETPD